MANQEHLDILAKGVEAWNAWREEDITSGPPELSDANLHGASLPDANLGNASLHGAMLRRADLRHADLSDADLSDADLSRANLRSADLTGADLSGANLSRADLRGADLRGANLAGANLSGANLSRANLRGARLSSADLNEAHIGATIFDKVDLSTARGLDNVIHRAASTIGIDTIYRSGGKIPEVFLRGCGVPDSFITYIRSLTGAALEFYSCFVSFSTKDQEFADRLYADLQAKGIRCWFAPHDMQSGRKIHEQIDEAIKVYDKLLLILSESSMTSDWVATEISKARKRERKEERRMLHPISIAPFTAVQEWESFDADAGKDSAREIREYFIPDFSEWKDRDRYQRAFDRLVWDLKAGQGDKAVAQPAP